MRIYTVHINPESPNAVERAVFVAEGFSWKAFIFGILWTLYHRLWAVSLVIFAIMALFLIVGEQKLLDTNSLFILEVAFNFFIGFNANDWRRNALSRHGYITYDVVASDSYLHARQRYFERVLVI
jgi:hypothetical protein